MRKWLETRLNRILAQLKSILFAISHLFEGCFGEQVAKGVTDDGVKYETYVCAKCRRPFSIPLD